MDSADAFVRRFKELGWRMGPYETIVPLVEARSPRLAEIAGAIVRELEDAPAFFGEILSQLDEAGLRQVADTALARSRSSPTESSGEALRTLALQLPSALSAHLAFLFDLDNGDDWHRRHAWRAADEAEAQRLEAELDGPDAESALEKLFETQNPGWIDRALAKGPAVEPRVVQLLAHQAACMIEDGHAVALTCGPCHHLFFDDDAPEDVERNAARPMDRLHPTRNFASSDDFRLRFGGKLAGRCGLCGGTLHRLIDLSALPAGFHVGASPPVVGTCLSCLGWERRELFYAHGGDGEPRCINGGDTLVEPQFPAEPLAEAVVRASSTPYRWQEQEYGDRANHSRLGGRPAWVQNADYPACPRCGTTMPFLAQIDSFRPTESGGEWLWGSGGLGYIFWCDGCRVSALKWQCT